MVGLLHSAKREDQAGHALIAVGETCGREVGAGQKNSDIEFGNGLKAIQAQPDSAIHQAFTGLGDGWLGA